MKLKNSLKFQMMIMALLFSSVNLFAQVSNVRVEQRTDGNFIVDIYYDFSNDEGYDTEIVLEASDDGGETWEFAYSSVTGDVGEDITAGTDKHIEWDFYADHPKIGGSDYKVRILYYFFSTMTGNDSTVYKTVKIGDQWWMAENLRETRFRDKTLINKISSSGIWVQYNNYFKVPCYAAYGYNDDYAATYGYLYNWYAMTESTLAPSGWHVSTDDDWQELEMFLGMSQSNANSIGSRGTVQGYQLKAASGWKSSGNGNNRSRFNAIPGGWCSEVGSCYNLLSYGIFWTDSDDWVDGTDPFRGLAYDVNTIRRATGYTTEGYSIRLVKDDE